MPRLLLVDHESTTYGTARQCLQSAGLVWATTLGRARAALAEAPVDLVVLELQLPDGSGLELLAEIAHRNPELPVIVGTRSASRSLRQAALRLGVKEYFEKPVDALTLANAMLTHLAPQCEWGHLVAAAADAFSLFTVANIADTRLRRAVEHLHEHYREKVNLTLVARAAAMGRFTLSHSFSHMLGVPFNKYLQRVRVVHAMRLLAATDQPVAHIAEAVGFTGLSRFNLVFRRITGVTPTAMRRQRRTVESDARASAARPEAYAKNAH